MGKVKNCVQSVKSAKPTAGVAEHALPSFVSVRTRDKTAQGGVPTTSCSCGGLVSLKLNHAASIVARTPYRVQLCAVQLPYTALLIKAVGLIQATHDGLHDGDDDDDDGRPPHYSLGDALTPKRPLTVLTYKMAM